MDTYKLLELEYFSTNVHASKRKTFSKTLGNEKQNNNSKTLPLYPPLIDQQDTGLEL